ncbi:MAG: phosphoglycerate dehydrogenase [Gemmatimonadetes bacterium]|nr:phosphoglycerate dehydrogenase [Gemmatimonadota bacterium]
MSTMRSENGGGRAGKTGEERFRVLVPDAVSRSGLAPLLEDARFDVEVVPKIAPDELAKAVESCDAIVVRSGVKVTRELLARARRVRVIGRAGVGVDNIDVDAATERGIAVLNAPAGNTTSAAELTFALILGIARKVAAADRSVREGKWARSQFAGTELHGKTLGLIGAGRIGGEVAKRARAFGMRVLAHDPYLSAERAEALGVERVSLAELLPVADFISLHTPLTAATRNLIGEAQLAMMKPTACLINVARGEIVDEGALTRALESGKIAGAALDVFSVEPLPADSPLRAAPNLLVTPHLGASTAEAQESVALEIAHAVRAALLEGDLTRAVNAPAIGGDVLRRLRPLLDLARRLGRLACVLAEGPVQIVEVGYAGSAPDPLRSLAASAMQGLLADVVGVESVNFVNALYLAEAHGMRVAWSQLPARSDYAEYLEVKAQTEHGSTRVSGALLADRYARVVRVGEYHVDVVPEGTLVILRNRDVPGVIGRVGTLLGSLGVNIAEYHQARLSAGGEALAAISVDGELPADALQALRRLPEIVDARQVGLG